MDLRTPVAALAAALLGCASYPSVPDGGAAFQAGTDFSSYRTFDFVSVPPGAARLAASLEYFGVDGVLARDLSAAGLARSIGGAPDLLVAYYQGGRQVDVTAWGYRTAGNPVVDVIDVPSSCLVVDLVDAGRGVLVWRGIATDALTSPQAVDPAVRQMLRGWPPRP
jgi:Domain of unknown function (DUF4136)